MNTNNNNNNFYNSSPRITRKQFADIAYYQPQYQQAFHTVPGRRKCLASNYSPNYNMEIAAQIYKNPNFKVTPPGNIIAAQPVTTINNAITTRSTVVPSANATPNSIAAITMSQHRAKKHKHRNKVVRWAELLDQEK